MGFNFNPQKYLEKNINFKDTFILLCYNFDINKKKGTENDNSKQRIQKSFKQPL